MNELNKQNKANVIKRNIKALSDNYFKQAQVALADGDMVLYHVCLKLVNSLEKASEQLETYVGE